MCGISGIIEKNSSSRCDEIVAMTNLIVHRGPDGFGYYHGENFSFGHRRLAILDLTSHGAQPMHYMEKYCITYNGEVYNYIEIKKELSEFGYTFLSNTDTEVVLAAYDRWGKDCLNKFNGMFAFAIFDKENKKIFCARDRFGVKPFYYSQVGNKFVFASEIKQFTAVNGWHATANLPRLRDFLLYGGIHDHTQETMFDNVYQLKGGTFLEYDLVTYSYKIDCWYDLKTINENKRIDFESAKTAFKTLFHDAVRLRLRSDVKVGSCLSGGLDSSAIVCQIHEMLREIKESSKQETVSACFNDKRVDEREYMDEVIHQTNVNAHKIFPSSSDLFKDLDKLVWHQDEPFGTTSVYAQWLVYKASRDNGLIVMLDGQGADEHLAGYSSFHTVHFNELMFSLKFVELFKSIKNYRKCYNDYYFSPYRTLFLRAACCFLPDRLLNKIKKYFSSAKNENLLTMDCFSDGKHDEIATDNYSIRDESLTKLYFTTLPKLLHHADRNSMAHSVESRTPFVDYKLIELAISLPSSFKINRAITKFIMRHSLSDLMPKKIVNRFDKLGFSTPQSEWTHQISKQFRIKLEEACCLLKNNVNKNVVLSKFDKSISRGGAIDSLFWRIVCVGSWMKVFKISL